MTNEEFNALLADVKEKKKEALELFGKYCVRIIRTHIIFKFGYSQDIDDWVNDVFVYKVMPNIFNYRIKNHIGWLHTVTDNYITDIFKKNKQTVELIENVQSDTYIDDVFDKWEADKILKDFDDTTRKILVLHHYYGYKLKEIAKILHITYDAVRQRASRAKIKIN